METCRITVLLVGLTALAQWMLVSNLNGEPIEFDGTVKPLLQKYCVRCHGDKEAHAKIRIDDIDPDVVAGEHFDRWEDIREAFNSGEMPPEDEIQPTPRERDLVTEWLDAEFKKAKRIGKPANLGKVRRLTRYELQHAIQDLLHFSIADHINSLPEEGTSTETGLKNNSRMLMISGPHLEAYLGLVVSVTDRMKEIVAFKPYTESLNIAKLNINPPQAFTRDKRKIKPPVAGLKRSGDGLMIEPKGYIDLMIPVISQYAFETILSAKSDAAGIVDVQIGFTRSDIDPRQNLAPLGTIEIASSDQLQTYLLTSSPNSLPRQMTRALDRPFFIRITNRSRKPIYIESFDYRGNVNTSLAETLIPDHVSPTGTPGHVRQSIANFLERAFRRPPTDEEFDRYYSGYQQYAIKQDSITALLSTYKDILCSPKFFYIGTAAPPNEESNRGYNLAERLSFFLWCSVPDRELLGVARRGELTKPSVLRSQVDRMLADKRSKRWVQQFSDQWLKTAMLFNVAVDKNYYPRFKEAHKQLMYQETIEAVNDVFRNGAPATDLIDADHVFVNQTLAQYYQLRGVRGTDFRKVAVKPVDHRGGLLTQGTFLVGHSDGMNSHAILRGVWLSEVLLNDPPPDPPKNVPPLDESIPGFDKMTLNQKLFAHRNNDACKNCHQKIDPWGIPFENYDASGNWRDRVLVVSKETKVETVTAKNGKTRKRKRTILNKDYVQIDRKSNLPGGTNVNGVDELKSFLLKHRKRDFAKGLTERILAYALSRDIDYHDEELVNELVDGFERTNYSVPMLIQEIVQRKAFTYTERLSDG